MAQLLSVRPMKTSAKYESIASLLAVIGAVALVGVYYPIINQEQFSIDFHRDDMPLSWYILGTPLSLAILFAAWHFNSRATRQKREERDVRHSDTTSA